MTPERRESPFLSPLRLTFFVLILAVGLSSILAFRLLPSRYHVREGQISPQTIKSPIRASFVSKIRSQQEREKAADEVADVLFYDPEIYKTQLNKVWEIDAIVSQISPLDAEEKSRAIRQMSNVELSARAMALTLSFEVGEWKTVVSETIHLLEEAYASKVSAAQVEVMKERLPLMVNPTLSSDQSLVATELAQALVVPNMLFDEVQTEKAQQEARERVKPVEITIGEGEAILRDGERIEALHLEELEAVGLLTPRWRWWDMGGVTVLAAILSAMLGLYLHFLQPKSVTSNRRLLLIAVVVIGMVLAAKLTIPGRPMWAHLFPIATASMLLVALLDTQVAIVVTALLSLLVSYVAGYSPEFLGFAARSPLESLELTSMYLVGGLLGLLLLGRAERLYRFFIAGSGVTVASFAVIVAFWLFAPDHVLPDLGWYAAASAVNGVGSAILTLGAFLLLGLVFGITTSLHLLELAQPNQPLLRRLLTEAPGTYHHSIIVGNLAERAADLIGADSLLVRVGSYYHDIGKVLHPAFFSENQMGSENIHDYLDPQTSARVVVAHVEDGLTLAQEHGLPAKIQDFIAQHHGTRLVTYFYHSAAQGGEEVDPGPYKYPGPRPQTKETAIMMLADSVEAAARGGEQRSPQGMDELVDRIVAERSAEGQLNECDLTFGDLEKVRGAFKGILKGIFHPRIEYPETIWAKPSVVEPNSNADGGAAGVGNRPSSQ